MKASICIPTVNRLEFFREALESAASQTFDDYEVLVSVNSSDSDYHEQVAMAVAEVRGRHPRRTIRMVRPPEFLHIADHTNFLVDNARGAYWCYLADDDKLEPQFLETLVSLLDAHGDAGFAFCRFMIIDEWGIPHPDLAARDARITHLDSLTEGFVPPATLPRLALWNALMLPCSAFRRTFLEQFGFESGHAAPDRDLWLRIADAPGGLGAVYALVPLVSYRHHGHSYTRLTSRSQRDLVRTLETCGNVAGAEPRVYRQEMARIHGKLGKSLLDEGRHREAWRALLTSMRENGRDWHTYRFVLQALMPDAALRCLRAIRRKLSTRPSHEAAATRPPIE